MKAALPFVFAIGLVACGPVSLAGDLSNAGAMAESQVQQGKFLEALATLSEAQDKVWRQSPLLFRKAVFVAGDPAGFGIYELREGNSFRRSETLVVYAEPVGFGYKQDGTISEVNLLLDFEVKSKDGRVIGGQKGFANPQLRSRVQNREFFVKVTYDFSGIPAGEYEVTTAVNDKTSGKSGSFTLPFTLTD
jgi:hypothetical protein